VVRPMGLLLIPVPALCWWVVGGRRSIAPGLLTLGMAPRAPAAPLAWQSWTDFHYTPSLRAQFAPWRGVIAPAFPK